jgi:mannose-6-phosphate isomerase-like protein (cupin superfamily)
LKKSNDILKSTLQEWLKEGETFSESEVQLTEDSLIRFAQEYSVSPSPDLKSQILKKISDLKRANQNRTELQLDKLPLLDASSNWLDWEKAVEGINPPENFEGIYLHTLESTPERQLFVAWVREYVEEEVHHDLLESFLLLEGTCECHITDTEGYGRVVRMGVGDFITMELGETHDVIITSLEPAKAILQWKKIRA